MSKEQRLAKLAEEEQRLKARMAPAHAADFFGADPSDPSAQGTTGLSPAQPVVASSDLELAFSKYEKSKAATKAPSRDVSTAMQRYEQSKSKGSDAQ